MTNSSYSLADYAKAMRRRAPLFLYIAFPIVLIGAGFALGLPDVYRSTAELSIELEGPRLNTVDPVMMTNYADQYVGNLQRRALSRDHVKLWLSEVDVYPDAASDTQPSDLVSQMYEDTKVRMVTTAVMDPRSGREVDLITGFNVSFDSADPEIAYAIAERMKNAFVEEDRKSRTEQAEKASSFLEGQLELKRGKIAELEGRIADFKQQNNCCLPEMLQLNMSVIDRTERELNDIQTQIRNLEQDRVFRKAQLQELNQNNPSSAHLQELQQEYVRLLSIYDPDHPDVVRLKRQIELLTSGDGANATELEQLETQLELLKQRYSDEHPDVVNLKNRIRLLKAEQSSGSRTGTDSTAYLQLTAQINALDTQLSGLRSRASELRSKLAETENNVARTPQVEREYQALTRDLSTLRDDFSSLEDEWNEKQRTIVYEEGELGARISVVRNPWAPSSPASPPRLAILLASLFLAISIAAASAIMAESVDSSVRGSRDIVAICNSQPIVAIPIVQNAAYRAVHRRKVFLTLLATVGATAIMLSFSGILRVLDLF